MGNDGHNDPDEWRRFMDESEFTDFDARDAT